MIQPEGDDLRIPKDLQFRPVRRSDAPRPPRPTPDPGAPGVPERAAHPGAGQPAPAPMPQLSAAEDLARGMTLAVRVHARSLLSMHERQTALCERLTERERLLEDTARQVDAQAQRLRRMLFIQWWFAVTQIAGLVALLWVMGELLHRGPGR